MSTMDTQYFDEFTKPVRKIGKTFLALAIVFSFISPIYISIRYNCMPTGAEILGGYVMILSTEAVYYFIEPISYFPTLGEAGNYMSFLAGSIGGIRVIATLGSQDAVGVEPGSHKAEIVSVIAVAASIVCSMALNLFGIVFGQLMFAILPESITGMFDFVLPAVYGAMLYMYGKRNVPVFFLGLVIAIIFRMSPMPGFLRMLLTVLICCATGVVMARKKAAREQAAG